MSIKGFTVDAAWPRIGRLRKGGPKKAKADAEGKTYEVFGDDLQWFRFVTQREDVAKAFLEAYGQQPAEFDVYLPYTTVDANFRYGRERYLAGGLDFLCDGESMILWRGEDGRMHTDRKPCPYCSGERERTRKDPGCIQYGRLTVLLPKLLERGFVGPVEIETHSWNDIRSILASLRQTMDMRDGNPMGLRGILFHVYRIAEKISTPQAENNRRKRARREKWLVKIEPAAAWVQAQLQAAYRASLLPDPYASRELEHRALLAAEREAAEILTPRGYVNAAHVGRDPEEPTTEELARELAHQERDRSLPVATPRNGRRRLFKAEDLIVETVEGQVRDVLPPELEPEEADPLGVPPEEIPPEVPPSEPKPPAAGHWTKVASERSAFLSFLNAHGLSEDEAKSILGEWLHRPQPLALFSEWPHDRARAQRVLLGWLMCHRPADPDTHWMRTNPGRKAAFWARMGDAGLDEKAVHERVPRTGTFPGDIDDLIDFVLHSKPEGRWQLALPGMEEGAS